MTSTWNFFCKGVTVEGNGETSVRSTEESWPKKSSYMFMVGGKAKKVMKDYPIIVDELSVPKEMTVGFRTPIRKWSRGKSHSPVKGQVDFTPSKVIEGAATHFQRRRVFTLVEPGVLVSIIEAPVIAFPLLQLLALLVEATVVRPSTRVIPEETKFKDVFANLTLSWAPFNFPTLIKKERQLMKAIIGGRSGIKKASLNVVRLLERILTIPSDISMMSNKSYSHYLALTDQMDFNVRNLLVHLLFSSMTILPNTCFLINLHDIRPLHEVLGGREESYKGGHYHKQVKPCCLREVKGGKSCCRGQTE